MGAAGKGKNVLNESDVTRDVDTGGNKVETAVTLVLVGVTKKHTGERSRC